MAPRIGIIGGGPAGISLARLLTDRNFADVTVFERADHVGGKSMTVQHRGLGHELGTCYTTSGYTVVHDWMKHAGITEYKLQSHLIYRPDGRAEDFKEWVLGSAGMLGAVPQMAQYVGDWLKFHDWDLRGCPDDTRAANGKLMREEMAQPFGTWLRARKLDVVERLALRTINILGYGSLEVVPALYGLRWNVPSLLWSAVTKQVGEPIPGWQALWESLAGRLDVRLSTRITAVDRKDKGFVIHANNGTHAVDHLVITTPLDEAATWFPFQAGEVPSFAWRDYVSTLIEAKHWFVKEDTRCWEKWAKDAKAHALGHMMVVRHTADKTPVSSARQGGPEFYVTYQYAGSHTDAELLEIMKADVAADGAQVTDVVRQMRWKYCPQLSGEAIKGGALSAFERRQGKGNLWITGASASHESVDNIVDYNSRLADRMVWAFAGKSPSSPDALAAIADKYRWKLDSV